MSQIRHAGIALLLSLCIARLFGAGTAAFADDLNPVVFKERPQHKPVAVVTDGRPAASIVLGRESSAMSPALQDAVKWLQEFIAQSTGSKLPVLGPDNGVMPSVRGPALVIGDCAEAAGMGLVGSNMPVEGFAIKTARDRVYLVGHDAMINGKVGAVSDGTAWAVIEFLERYAGVRWYYPDRRGLSIPATNALQVPPVWIEDAPVFRKREMWRVRHPFLRCGNSWPVAVRVHASSFGSGRAYRESQPEVFELKEDGTRNYGMPCFGNPGTLAAFIEEIDRELKSGGGVMGVRGNIITVSPPDAPIRCHCYDCRKLWDEKRAGVLGNASLILARFVEKLAGEAKTRWPDATIIYLPYVNYTIAPAGVSFPGNVEVQICGMPGLAYYKEPAVRDSEQANIDAWMKISGRRIQNWHYSCWPAHRTQAAFQYPHVVKEHYLQNRGKTVGSFINGPDTQHQGHWPRFHITFYCWLKTLWNPEFDVDAAMDEYCRRMFGKASGSMRELMRLQVDGWEKSRWPQGRLALQAIYTESYPPETIGRMKELLGKAHNEAMDDSAALERIGYYSAPFAAFFKEAADVANGMAGGEN